MFKRITAYLSLISLIVVSLAPVATFAADPSRVHTTKTAPEFDKANNSSATVRVLIQTKGAPSAAQDDAVANAHGSKRASHSALNMIVADVPLNTVASLAARDDIVYIAPDRPVKSQLNLTNDATGASQVQPGLAGMPGFDGKGVTIAILDTGISANHPDFMKNNKSRVIASVDFSGSSRAGDA